MLCDTRPMPRVVRAARRWRTAESVNGLNEPRCMSRSMARTPRLSGSFMLPTLTGKQLQPGGAALRPLAAPATDLSGQQRDSQILFERQASKVDRWVRAQPAVSFVCFGLKRKARREQPWLAKLAWGERWQTKTTSRRKSRPERPRPTCS